MRNKKGDLVKNVLSLIIAALGIALLVFAAYKLYRVNVENEGENAKQLLDSIEGKIGNLKDGEIGRFSMRGIKDWNLVVWSKEDARRPDKCYFNSCICTCKGDSTKIKDVCQESGICHNLDFVIAGAVDFFKAKENAFSEEDVIKDIYNPKYYNKYAECIDFKGSNLAEILIYKNKNYLGIINVKEVDPSHPVYSAACQK